MDNRCRSYWREVNQAHACCDSSTDNQTNQDWDGFDKSFSEDINQEDDKNSDSCKEEALTSWFINVISHISDSDRDKGQTNGCDDWSCNDRREEIGHFWKDARNEDNINPWHDKGTKHSTATMTLTNHNERRHGLEGNPEHNWKTDTEVFIELKLEEGCHTTHEDISWNQVG